MLGGGTKTTATGFMRHWCLTNLTFCSAFQGLLFSCVLLRTRSSGALSLGQLQGSQQVKHPKWQIRILRAAASDSPLSMLSGKRNHLGRSGLCKEHPIKDPNTRGNWLSYELASTCSYKSSSGESKSERPFSRRTSEPPLFSL